MRGGPSHKSFPIRLDEIAREKGIERSDVEVWFADEARIGQKNKITRRWARLAQGSIRLCRMEGKTREDEALAPPLRTTNGRPGPKFSAPFVRRRVLRRHWFYLGTIPKQWT